MNITTSKPQATINQEKRGGFLNNSKAIRGNKIQAPKKSVSKPKNITFWCCMVLFFYLHKNLQ